MRFTDSGLRWVVWTECRNDKSLANAAVKGRDLNRIELLRTAAACTVLALALPFAGCAVEPPANPAAWESPRHVDHPLVGRIWDSRLQRFALPEELLAGLGEARFLLLGEKHDNADHHSLQFSVLESLISNRALSGVAFEMIDASRAERLESISDREFADAAELKAWLE